MVRTGSIEAVAVDKATGAEANVAVVAATHIVATGVVVAVTITTEAKGVATAETARPHEV